MISSVAVSSLRILLAASSETTSELIARTLRANNIACEITSRADGATLLETLGTQAHDFDLVVVDQDLPDMSGPRLAARAREVAPALAVVLFVAPGEERGAARALLNGVTDYLVADPGLNYAVLLPMVLTDAVHRAALDRPAAAVTSLRILLGASSETTGKLIARTLRANNMACEITPEADGAVFLETLGTRARDFDLVLVGQDLPDMLGPQLAVHAREMAPALAVVLLVAPGEEREAARALLYGVTDYVVADPGRNYAVLLPMVLTNALHRAAPDRPGATAAPPAPAPGADKSEDFYLGLYNGSPVMLHSIDRAGKLISVSDHWLKRLGYTRDEVIGTQLLDYLTPESQQLAQDVTLPAYFKTGTATDVPYQFVTKGGETIDALVSAEAARDAEGRFLHSTAVVVDVTDHKRTEAGLRANAQEFRMVVEQASDGITIADRDGNYVAVNPEACALLGYTEAELLRLNIRDLLAPGELESQPLKLDEILAGRTVVSQRCVRRKDGTEFHAEISARMLEDGRVQGIIRDVTDRHEAERKLAESHALLHGTLEATADGILVVDAEGRVLTYNQRFVDMWRIPDEVIATRRDDRLLASILSQLQDPDAFLAKVQEVYAHGDAESFDTILFTDGRIFERQSQPQRIGEDTLARVWSFRDVTGRVAAEGERRHAEARLRTIVVNAPVMLFALDRDGRFTLAEGQTLAARGLRPTEIIGKSIFDRFRDAPAVTDAARRALAGEEFTAHISVSGVDMEVRFAALRDEAGELDGAIGVATDITERVQAQARRAAAEERLGAVVANAPVIMFAFDPDGVFTFAEGRGLAALGFEPAQLVGRSIFEIAAEAPQVIQSVRAALAGEDFTGLVEVGELAFETRYSPVRDAAGAVVGVTGVATDCSDRVLAERELRASEEKYRLLTTQVRDLIWSIDNTGRFTYGSPAIERLTGFTVDDILGKGLDTIVHPDSMAHAAELFARGVTGEIDDILFEADLLVKGGGKVPCEISCVVIRDADGQLERVNGITRDITERKQAEEQLEFTQFSVDHAPDAMYWIQRDARIIYGNEAASQMLGYTREELLHMTVFDLDTTFPREGWDAHWAQLEREVTFAFESVHRRKDGSTFPIEMRANLLEFRGQTYTCVFVRDITDRRKAEETLRASEGRYRNLAERAHDVIWATDSEGCLTYVSPAVERVLGFTPEEAMGLHFLTGVVQNDASVSIEELMQSAQSGTMNEMILDVPLLTKDNRPVWCEVSVVAVRDNAGHITSFQGVTRDISGRKQAEADRDHLESQIQHAQKLESLGVLAGGIAHDFNNLLVGMLGNAGLAMMDLPEASPAHGYLRRVETAAQRAADLTNQLLAYSGRGKFVIHAIDLSTLVQEMTELLSTVLSKSAVLKYNLAPDLSPIEGDATQIRQVVMNLITNASDAIGDRSGVISLTTSTIFADRAYLNEMWLDEELPEGTYVYLEVSDTGAGMDDETVRRIFDPFFSTKFTGRGLGLAAVLGIVRGHHGALKVYSEPGHGTTFKVLFPAADLALIAAPEEEPALSGWQPEGTVLIVDDEENVQEVARAALERIGFATLSAMDGREGLDVYKQHADEIVLVLLDMTMPQMNGEETYRELRRLYPDVRVVLSSGYNEQDATDQFAGKGLAGFIQKPYSPTALLDRIRDALQD